MDIDKVSVRFVSVSINEVFAKMRLVPKCRVLVQYVVLVLRCFVSGRVKGAGDGLNLERLVLVVA